MSPLSFPFLSNLSLHSFLVGLAKDLLILVIFSKT